MKNKDSEVPELFEIKGEGIEITDEQAELLTKVEEGQFSEAKATAIIPSKLSRTISAFANTDGGDLYPVAGFFLAGRGLFQFALLQWGHVLITATRGIQVHSQRRHLLVGMVAIGCLYSL